MPAIQLIRTGKDSQDGGSNAAGTLQAGTHGQGGCPKISRIRSFQQHGHKLVSPEHSARRRNCCQFQSKREDAALGKHTTLSIFPQLFTQSGKSNGHNYAFLRFEHALLIAPHGEDCDYTSVGRFPMKWTRPLEQFTELALVLWLWDLFGRPLFSFRHSTR